MDLPCASGGVCADGVSRCPAYEYALQTGMEFAVYSTLCRPGMWFVGDFGVTGLNQDAALSDLKLQSPELRALDARPLLAAGEMGRFEAEQSLRSAATQSDL